MTNVYPYRGDICFTEYVIVWSDLPYTRTPVTLPEDGDCDGTYDVADTDGEDYFAITIDVIKVKKGEAQLKYAQPLP